MDPLLGNFKCFQQIQGMQVVSLVLSFIPNFDRDARVDF